MVETHINAPYIGNGINMKFFRVSDFDDVWQRGAEYCAKIANTRLEVGGIQVKGNTTYGWATNEAKWATHKALVVNIEPIETCKHPLSEHAHKRYSGGLLTEVICRCGQRLTVTTTFEEMK